MGRCALLKAFYLFIDTWLLLKFSVNSFLLLILVSQSCMKPTWMPGYCCCICSTVIILKLTWSLYNFVQSSVVLVRNV